MAETASADAIWKDMQARGVEFVFAQFVDMYARPSAKLVPVGSREAFDGLLADGAGFAGFAAGEIGQVPSDPDIAAIPDLASYTPVPWQPNLARFACDVTVEGEEWPYCPRTILRRVLAHAKAKGFEFKMGLELEYFLVQQREDGSIEIADRVRHAREALLRHGRAHPPLRLPDDGLALLQRARLGQLRERPRGRERPVRAELHLRRRARLVRPRDLLPLHGPHARGAARDDRDVHAEAVLAPDGERLPLPHVALGRRHEPLPRRVRPARARPLRDRLPLHRRPARSTRARTAAHRADRQLVQAAEARHDGERRDLVAGLDLVRLQQPHADAPHPGPRADRGPHDRRLLQPVPRGGGRARRRARRDRERARRGRAELGEPLRDPVRRSSGRAGSSRCRRTCSRRSASSSATTCCARRSDAAATRTTSTTSRASSATSGSATTSRSRRGRSAST